LDEFAAAGLDVKPMAIGGKVSLWAARYLEQAARTFQADFLHTHLSSASWWAGWSERWGGTPSLGHVHGFTNAAWHRQQSHLIAVSQAVKDYLEAQGIAGERITVIHNAADADDMRPTRLPAAVRESLGADVHTPVVGIFAHLSAKKGWLDLFAAIPMILASEPRAQFWCVGAGPLDQRLHKAARRGGFQDAVRLTGYRRDVADLMRAVDVVALPSHREPCALVFIEAALLARPVIGCRSGGTPELVADNETGLLVPPRDPESLAKAILTMFQNRVQAQTMGRRGRERALDQFSWSRYLTELEKVYDGMRGSR
jgi:glycosyltransferase involved in cell wall biosynthesis